MPTQEENPYLPPSTNSINTPIAQTGKKRTIEEAIAYDYDFNIKEVISKAWTQVQIKGIKHKFLFSLFIFIAFFICSSQIEELVSMRIPYIGVNVITSALDTYIFASFAVIALKHLRGESIDPKKDFFSISSVFMVLFISELLVNVLFIVIFSVNLTIISCFLLVIPSIYLLIVYTLTSFIIIDTPNISAWQAMETSRKIISKKWFKVFLFVLLLNIVTMASAIPALIVLFGTESLGIDLFGVVWAIALGIGLFWTLPLYTFSIGILYQTIFEE